MARKKGHKSQLEDSFYHELDLFKVPLPLRNHMFHPTRKWALDFAWPEWKIAVEIHGGIFAPNRGGHNRGAYMEETFSKINEAIRIGWRVFTFGPSQVRRSKRQAGASPALNYLYAVLKSNPPIVDVPKRAKK